MKTKVPHLCLLAFTAAVLLATTQRAQAQANVPIYAISTGDVLVNGFQDGSYNATVSYVNTSICYSTSTYSISVSASDYGALGLLCNLGNNNLGNNYLGFNTSPYASLSFWINGGSSGGQVVTVWGVVIASDGSPMVQGIGSTLTALTANTWTHYTIPLSTLSVANMASCNGFSFQIQDAGTAPTFYVDEIQLVPVTAPATTQIGVNAAQTVRTADARWLGMNAAVWDNWFDNPNDANPTLDTTTSSELTDGGWQILRYPGGGEADFYNWSLNTILTDHSNPTGATTSAGSTPFSVFAQMTASLGSQMMITVNYGSGTPQEAAAWVAYANAATSSTVSLGTDIYGVNWQTAGHWASLRAAAPLGTDDGYNFLRISQTAPFGVKYWELGNELYGALWSTDDNTDPFSPSEYATHAHDYFAQMKAVDSTIKCGVDVEVGEDSFANGYTTPAVNTSTEATHYGWTPVLLSNLKNLGVTPDFLSYHWYPEDGNDNDWILLQGTSKWTSDAANLRYMINNYFGTAPNIELLCTENNNDPGSPAPPSKQSVSLVNALYYTDSFGQLTQTEFNSFLWWDLRNYLDNSGDDTDPTLYGWRAYGDLGIMNMEADSLLDRYPTFFSAKLIASFVGGGDSVLSTTSNNGLLSAYSVHRTSGNLTLLVINKDPSTTFSTQIALTGFTPNASATVYSYGIPQDTAAENANAAGCDVAQSTFSSAAATFDYSFAPYSMTVFVLAPSVGVGTTPSISSFAPSSGTNNTSVIISGQNFGTTFSGAGATTVAFNGTSATITSGSATSITAKVPSGATTGPITVTVPNNGTGTSANSFTRLYSLYVYAQNFIGFAGPDGTVTITANGTSATGASVPVAVPQSLQATLTATANPGFIFEGWQTVGFSLASTNSPYTITLNANSTYGAYFEPAFTYINTASPANGGTVSTGGTELWNDTVTVTATNNPGYVFSEWMTNGVLATNTASYSFSPNTNISITNIALFTPTPPQIVVLNGTTVIANNQTFDFGAAQQNAQGSNVTFTVTNSGGAPLALGIASVPSGFIVTQNPNPLGTLAFGASNTFSVQLDTTTVGPYSGNIIITNNSASSFTIAVAGTVANPTPQITVFNGTNAVTNGQTSPVNFGSTQQNQPCPIVTFTVINSGRQALDLGAPQLPPGFALVTYPPFTIPANGSGTFSVQLDTTTVGAFSGTITITNNANHTNVPFIFPISGTVNGEIISLSGNLAFGGVALGASTTLILTISNSGNSTLTVSNISFSPAVFSGAWSGIIAAGGSTNVPVAFSPAVASNYNGMVTVNSDDTSGNATCPVSGYGKNGTLVLTIDINGPGSVSPNQTGQTLPLNSKHKITATPTPGSDAIFAGWTGSITTNKNPFNFTMEPSTVLEANFISNPFPPFVGTYNGLFIDTNDFVTEATAGMLKELSVNSQGAYTGTLLINGTNHAIDGTFDPTSTRTTNLYASDGSEGKLTVVMSLVNSSNSAPQITGTVSGSAGGVAWAANLMADFATNLPSAEYTMLILPDTNNTPPNMPPNTAPGGVGYALISYHADTATITGALADGASLDQKVAVSQDGYVPIYDNLYGGKGLLLGWINLDSTNATGVSLTWIHPATHAGLYQKGFTNVLLANQLPLSPWVDSPANLNLLTRLTSLSILDTINDTTPQNQFTVMTTAAGKVSGVHVSGTINRTNGQLTVTFPTGAVGHGAVLLNQTNAGGYLLTSPTAKAIQLAP